MNRLLKQVSLKLLRYFHVISLETKMLKTVQLKSNSNPQVELDNSRRIETNLLVLWLSIKL